MEDIMNLRSLTPFRERSGVARPEFGPFGSLQREIDRLFEDFTRGFGGQGNGSVMPSIDVTETDKEIQIAAELPGLERKDVDISIEDNVLTIRGEKKVEREEKDEKNKNYRLAERSYGVFYRVIELPSGIDPSQVQATMSKGVLTIKIPKPARSQAKKIEVKEAA
jgi:HSP20 family protein